MLMVEITSPTSHIAVARDLKDRDDKLAVLEAMLRKLQI